MKVLIGDDDAMIAKSLSMILKHSGFEAMDVHSGASIIAAAAKWQPDLLLLDLNLEDMHGVDVALAVKAELPWCRVLFLSGEDMPAERARQAAAAGYSFDCILKPIYPSDLLAVLREGVSSGPAAPARKRPTSRYACGAMASGIA